MNRGFCLAIVLGGCVTGCAWAGGPGGGNGGGGGTSLTPAEEEGLVYMREEEKLARDVYEYFDDMYDAQIFANIAVSEKRHMDAILGLLDSYEIDDPAEGMEPGEFTNATLQALYDQLIDLGSASLEAALGVGVTIEETDIADLEARLENVVHNDIRQVYNNLLDASERHLAAFTAQLDGETPGLKQAQLGGDNARPWTRGNESWGQGAGNGQRMGARRSCAGQASRLNCSGDGQPASLGRGKMMKGQGRQHQRSRDRVNCLNK